MKKMTEENLWNAFAEQIHATNHLRTLFRTLSGIGQTAENLQKAIYPAYVGVAQGQNELGAETTAKWAFAAE